MTFLSLSEFIVFLFYCLAPDKTNGQEKVSKYECDDKNHVFFNQHFVFAVLIMNFSFLFSSQKKN